MGKIYFYLAAASMMAATSTFQVGAAQALKAESDLPTTVITEQPAGTHFNAVGVGHTYYSEFDYIWDNSKFDGGAEDLVVADDAVYFKRPVFTKDLSTWIKGDRKAALNDGDPDTVVFNLPQALGEIEDAFGFSKKAIYAFAYTVSGSSSSLALTKSSSQTIKMVWVGDTLKQVNDGEVLGYGYADGNYINGQGEMRLYKLNEEATSLPADAPEAQQWVLKRSNKNNTAENVRVVLDGSNIYVANLTDYAPDLWVKGTIDGNKATFKAQLMGKEPEYNFYRFFTPVKIDTVGAKQYNYNPLKELTFDYDVANQTLSTNGAFLVQRGKTILAPASSDTYVDTRIYHVDDKAYTPSAPVIKSVVPYDDFGEYGILEFTLDPKSTDGKYLDEEKLYYELYLDDQAYTFTTDKYPRLESEMTEIPFSFSNKYFKIQSGTERWVYFYDSAMESAQKVGVRAIYKGGDTSTPSAISYASTSSVEGVNVAKEVKSVVYTDLSGRRVSEPQSGLYLKTVSYADGSTVTSKVVK